MFDIGGTSSCLAGISVIELLYQYAYLRGRRDAGVELPSNESERLRSLRSLLEHDDHAQRRSHRRRAAALPVLLKVGARLVRATVLNVSGGGVLVACPLPLRDGKLIRATFGEPGETQYIFTCKVVRQDETGSRFGLSFTGIPLEIRYGRYGQLNEARERAAS